MNLADLQKEAHAIAKEGYPSMKPYYEHAGITIYHGDCREVLLDLDLTGGGRGAYGPALRG